MRLHTTDPPVTTVASLTRNGSGPERQSVRFCAGSQAERLYMQDAGIKVEIYIVTTNSKTVLKVTESETEAAIYLATFNEYHTETRRRAKIRKQLITV